MNFLMMDTDGEGMGVDLALRAKAAGHEVRYWHPEEDQTHYGRDLLECPREWEESIRWAHLTVLTGNSTYPKGLEEAMKEFPVFGTNEAAAELELDRGIGQEALQEHGIEILPYIVVDSPAEAIEYIVGSGQPYVMKPWGGDADKSMTAVPSTVEEAVYIITKWEKQGSFHGQLMLQEKVDGIEMGIAGWFGPGGFNEWVEESWEHKKFLVGDLGENTGEMGTVIRHVQKSKLFDLMLKPLEDLLQKCEYTGDCSVNCIIDDKGQAWPLEFTMRLGWPDFCIRQSLVQGDPLEWMLDLLHGRDSFRVSSDIATGVLMAHGDFPKCKDHASTWSGFPIYGVGEGNKANLHFQQVMQGKGPLMKGGQVVEEDMIVTAGSYVVVGSGTGGTVVESREAAYETVKSIKWPGNLMYRTDIGLRLEEQLPILQSLGYAKGMRFG